MADDVATTSSRPPFGFSACNGLSFVNFASFVVCFFVNFATFVGRLSGFDLPEPGFEVDNVGIDLRELRLRVTVHEADDGAVDSELADARDHFEHAQADRDRLRDEVPHRREPGDHQRHHEPETDALRHLRAFVVAFVAFRIREGEREAAEQLDPEAYRDERPDVPGAAVRPRVRMIEAHQPDVVDDVADGDGRDPDGNAREDDTRVIHGETVMQNAKFKMQTLWGPRHRGESRGDIHRDAADTSGLHFEF